MKKENHPSATMRATSAESDCLHLGMGWTYQDLSKLHVMIQSSYGESHPGSSHLMQLSNSVRDGVLESGARPAAFVVTDMCDGVAQGSTGNHYSLPSREFIANMVEIQARATFCDGIVFISSCDKSVPAHLVAAGRLNIPALFMPGGVMANGACSLSCDAMWDIRRSVRSGKLTEAEFERLSASACPTQGACQQFGTAGTMQAMAEALGMALPGTSLIPVSNTAIHRACRAAGAHVKMLIERDIRPRDIMVKEAFCNAISVHAAIGGSLNAVMHLIAAARNAGVEIGVDDFERIHRRTPYLADVLSTGQYPTEYFWYAGGVHALMWEIRELLELDVMTVTGRTLGENLELWKRSGESETTRMFLSNYRLEWRDIIHPVDKPRGKDGAVTVLRGNIAPQGALIKHSAVPPEMMVHRGRAAVFVNEDDALEGLEDGRVRPGDVIVIVGQGPRACGMPEMFRVGEVIARKPELLKTTAVMTDGRYSGCTIGPTVGYVCPEAADGGPIGKVKTGDVIEINVPERTITLIGGDVLLMEREGFQPVDADENPGDGNGVLNLYRKNALPALQGGGIKA